MIQLCPLVPLLLRDLIPRPRVGKANENKALDLLGYAIRSEESASESNEVM